MSKALRLSEKWFRFGLWIVAFVFASFLIGLGGTVVENLPKVEHRVTLENFIDKPAAERLRAELRTLQEKRQIAQDANDQQQLKLNAARANSAAARDTFSNWLATRHATKRPEQDAELIERTQALDELKIIERKALADVERQQQNLLDSRQAEERAQRDMRELENAASGKLATESRSQELRVFLYHRDAAPAEHHRIGQAQGRRRGLDLSRRTGRLESDEGCRGATRAPVVGLGVVLEDQPPSR